MKYCSVTIAIEMDEFFFKGRVEDATLWLAHILEDNFISMSHGSPHIIRFDMWAIPGKR